MRDVAIITACQRIEHYQIAVYSAVCNFAVIISETEQSSLLEPGLEEENDEALAGIAESANTRADRAGQVQPLFVVTPRDESLAARGSGAGRRLA